MVEIFIGAVVDSVVVCFSSFMVVSDVKEFSSETFSSFAYSALVEKYSTVYRGTVETKKTVSLYFCMYAPVHYNSDVLMIKMQQNNKQRHKKPKQT